MAKQKGKEERKPNPIINIYKYINFEIDEIGDEELSVVPKALYNIIWSFIKYPKTVNILNKYLNSFDNYAPEQILGLLRFLIRKLGINRLHSSYYGNRETKKDVIYELLDKIFDFPLNDLEKSFYYELYRNNIIDDELIDNIAGDKNIKPTKTKDEDIAKLIEEYFKNNYIKTTKELEEVILKKKQNKIYCNACPLKDKPKLIENEKDVILDTNKENTDDIQILFLGINPGRTEVEVGKPFVGDAGRLLRDKILEYIESRNIGYLITNVIFCSSNNQSELGKNPERISIKYCKYYQDIIKNLPNLKLIVLLGDIPKKVFGITQRITQVSGMLFDYNDNIKLMPIPHPSAVIRSPKSKTAQVWEQSWENLNKFIEDNLLNAPNIQQTTNHNINIERKQAKYKEIENLDELPEDETFFDVRILKEQNKYLIIMIDKKGNKKYYLMPFKFIFYVNKNHNPQLCSYLEDVNNLDGYIMTSYYDLQKLKQYKSKDIKELIKGCKI
jgi:DNA polymerase